MKLEIFDTSAPEVWDVVEEPENKQWSVRNKHGNNIAYVPLHRDHNAQAIAQLPQLVAYARELQTENDTLTIRLAMANENTARSMEQSDELIKMNQQLIQYIEQLQSLTH